MIKHIYSYTHYIYTYTHILIYSLHIHIYPYTHILTTYTHILIYSYTHYIHTYTHMLIYSLHTHIYSYTHILTTYTHIHRAILGTADGSIKAFHWSSAHNSNRNSKQDPGTLVVASSYHLVNGANTASVASSLMSHTAASAAKLADKSGINLVLA